jgi:hypothetical protein
LAGGLVRDSADIGRSRGGSCARADCGREPAVRAPPLFRGESSSVTATIREDDRERCGAPPLGSATRFENRMRLADTGRLAKEKRRGAVGEYLQVQSGSSGGHTATGEH